ncbi:MAG: diaminopimelate epimerase [Acidobacteria bacterium]|nr:MAG: diaminopimelate epimerase [Acidobacteriota bacterium]
MTMAKALKVPFAKFHGLGNDFLVVRGQSALAPLAAFARAITARHTGLGADGLVVIMPPRGRSNDARARFFNADGSEAEMSGNGIRCAAAFLGGERGSKRVIRIETGAGVRPVRSVGRLEPAKGGTSSVFEVGMGEPILDGPKIPFKAGDFPSPIVRFQLRTERGLLPVTVTSMGNPHCTVLVADFDSFDWPRLGREIERNPLFPRRTNVEFVKLVSKAEIQARFWERGVS